MTDQAKLPAKTIKDSDLKPGDTIEFFQYGPSKQVCVYEREGNSTISATYIGKYGDSRIFGRKGEANCPGFGDRSGKVWMKDAIDKSSDFDSYDKIFTCGSHVECRVIPSVKTSNKSLIGLGLGLIAGAALSAWLKNAAETNQTTGVRAPELEEAVEEEIEVEVDLSELTS
jgi:hypothetical protein